MNTFYSREELAALDLKSYGDNVFISRNAIIYHPHLVEIGHDVRIDDFTIVSGKVTFGNYIHVSQFCGLYGATAGLVLEDFSNVAAKSSLYATSNDYSGEWMTNPMIPEKYEQGSVNLPVHLGRHVIIGCSSVVLPGVDIAEGCALGAMTLCRKSTEPWGIYAGIPARRIKERSKRLLELEQQFLAEEQERLK